MSDENYDLDIDPKKVCRICLSQSDGLQNLFFNSIVDGYILSIPEIVEYAIDIDIQPNASLPNKICGDCKQQVIGIYTFKKKSKRIEKSLKSMFIKNPKPTTAVKQETAIEIIEPQSILGDRIICAMCNTHWDNEEEFYDHLQVDHAGEIDVETGSGGESEPQEIIEFSLDEDVDTADESMMDVSETQVQPVVSKSPKVSVLPVQQKQPKTSIMKSRPINSPVKIKPNASNQGSSSSSRTKVKALNIKPSEKQNRKKKSGNETDEGSQIEFDMDLSTDDVMHQSLDEYECYLCALTYVDRQEYIEHCKTHDFYCDICCKVVSDENELREHKNKHKDSGDGSNDDLFCGPCNKRLRSSAQVEQHCKMHESMSLIINYIEFFPCHDCTLIFVNNEKLQEHLSENHKSNTKKEKNVKIKKIDETCTDYQFLEEEKEEEYRDGPYGCGHCGATYSTATELKYHVILHADKFSCPIFECGCEYDQLSRLSIHVLNKHINMTNLQCLHCNDSFNTYDDLQSHLRNDCREKKFACNECDKKFFSKKALVTHIRTLKEKKYKCNFCGKTFKQQGELTIHTRTHTNERPFKCTICAKSYKTSSMRAAHMDSHIAGKTFECTLCDKKLQSRTSYRNHMKRHTEEKKHTCEACGKKFFTGYHLRLHASKVHAKMVKMERDEDEEVLGAA